MPVKRLVAWTGALVIGRRDLWLGACGVGLGLLLTEALCRWALQGLSPWLAVPMGASAVLVFAVPASPLAQPWPVLGGNAVSALCGVLCYRWFGDAGWVAALAAALAVGAMVALHCLHPPGGAMALTAVLGGAPVHAMGFGYAALPVALNSLVLLALAVVFNRAAGRTYPHRPAPARGTHDTRDPLPSRRAGIRTEDLDAALASYGEVLDIDRGDLEQILARAQAEAQRRQWGTLRCADIMSRDLVTVGPDEPSEAAWRLLAQHRIKSLPVVDAERRLVGIVSVPDFFIDRHDPGLQAVPRMLRHGRVADIMTRSPRTAQPGWPLVELAAWFSDLGLHHLPVVDGAGRLVGMITQSDLVGALLAPRS